MKQKLLNILSEKNKKVTKHSKPCASLDQYSITRKISQRSHKLPIEMTKFEREQWLFEMLSNHDQSKQDQQLKEIYMHTTRLITRYRNKEIRWKQKKEAL